MEFGRAVVAVFILACTSLVAHVSCQFGPCRDTYCPRGTVCIPHVQGDRSWTTCECPKSCPGGEDPVCSIFNKQFKNPCELHVYACKLGISMAIKNRGPCSKPKDPKMKAMTDCPEWMLKQFPYRFLDWLYLSRQVSKNPRHELSKRGEQLTDMEIKDVLMWEFNNWDLNNNGAWDKDELDLVMGYLMPVESCSFGFVKSCDLDKSGDLDQREWILCFPDGKPDTSLGSYH